MEDHLLYGPYRNRHVGPCQFCGGLIEWMGGFERSYGGEIFLAHRRCSQEVMCYSTRRGPPEHLSSLPDYTRPDPLRFSVLQAGLERHEAKPGVLRPSELVWETILDELKTELRDLLEEADEPRR